METYKKNICLFSLVSFDPVYIYKKKTKKQTNQRRFCSLDFMKTTFDNVLDRLL